MIGFQLDTQIRVHVARQLSHLDERCLRAQGTKSPFFIAEEPIQGPLARGAMDSYVGHLAHPPTQVRLERFPALEGMAGDGIALHVADAVLVLALGSGSKGSAGTRTETPVGSEGAESIREHDLAGLHVVAFDELARVVDEQLLGEATEVPPRGLDAHQPVVLPFVVERLHERAPRIAKGDDAKKDPDPLAGDEHPRLTEVRLHLFARRRFESNGGHGAGPNLAPKRRHGPLDGSQRHFQPELASQLLANHIGVAVVLHVLLGNPLRPGIQHLAPSRSPVRLPSAGIEVPLYGVLADAELARDPFGAPALAM